LSRSRKTPLASASYCGHDPQLEPRHRDSVTWFNDLDLLGIGLKRNELFVTQVVMPDYEGHFNHGACQGVIDVASFCEALSLVNPKEPSNEIKFRACISQTTPF
jgi:hypothetical protein